MQLLMLEFSDTCNTVMKCFRDINQGLPKPKSATLQLEALTGCCEGTTTEGTTEAATTEATTEAATTEATTEAAAESPAPIVDTNQSVLYNKNGGVLDAVSLHYARAGRVISQFERPSK